MGEVVAREKSKCVRIKNIDPHADYRHFNARLHAKSHLRLTRPASVVLEC